MRHRTSTISARTSPIRAGLAPWIAAGLALGVGMAACGDDTDGGADDPPATAPSGDVEAGEFDESLIVGLPVDEAQQVVEDEGWEFRVAVIDGEEQMLTMDYVENRVNVVVDDGLVEGIHSIG